MLRPISPDKFAISRMYSCFLTPYLADHSELHWLAGKNARSRCCSACGSGIDEMDTEEAISYLRCGAACWSQWNNPLTSDGDSVDTSACMGA